MNFCNRLLYLGRWRNAVEMVLFEISNSMKPYSSVFHAFFMLFWALLLKGQKGGGQSGEIPVMRPSIVMTYYWPG